MAKPWILFDLDGTLNEKDEADKTKFNPTISITTFKELKQYYQIGVITNSKYFLERYKHMEKAGFILDGYAYREKKLSPKNPIQQCIICSLRQKVLKPIML